MSAKMSGFVDFASNVNNLFNMRQTEERRRKLQGADIEAPDGTEIRAAAFRGRCVGAPPGTRHASSHHQGPALYCRFCWSRSLGPRSQEMGKAMRLALTFHSPFPPKNVFRGI